MIKRLFRKRLRREMANKFNERAINFEESFLWVYSSPMGEWNKRLHCIAEYWHYSHGSSKIQPAIRIDLEKAKLRFTTLQ